MSFQGLVHAAQLSETFCKDFNIQLAPPGDLYNRGKTWGNLNKKHHMFLGFLRVLRGIQGDGVEPWGTLRIPFGKIRGITNFHCLGAMVRYRCQKLGGWSSPMTWIRSWDRALHFIRYKKAMNLVKL